MLKHRKKIDILERYCGKHARHFEWIGFTYPRKVASASAFITKNKILVTLSGFASSTNDEPTDESRVKVMIGSTNTIVFDTSMTQPDGVFRCEKKLGEIISALTPDVDSDK